MTQLSPFRSKFNWLRAGSYAPRSEDRRLVTRVKRRAKELSAATDTRLAEHVDAQRSAVSDGASPFDRDVIREVFACVTEAIRRKLGMEYYEVQLLAGLVLATGSIAEMKTGEGKTIVSALPGCLGAISGNGVHVATVNSYLAARDFELLQPVYEMLGFSTGLLRDEDKPQDKRAAYSADITYGTGYEFGFDYLRDQLALQGDATLPLGRRFLRQLRGQKSLSETTVQNGLSFAIIDEVDSVLIDEANTPLVISGPAIGLRSDPNVFHQARELASQLVAEDHYELDPQTKAIELTDDGLDRIFEDQPVSIQRPWNIYVQHALKAQLVLRRDVDYVVSKEKVKIVDPYTGRIFDERTWRDGLHQAIESKEGVTVTDENRSLAQISRQNFYQQYDVLCGMTGTALGHEPEVERFYQLAVVKIPQRKRCQRAILPARFFASRTKKLEAVAATIQDLHATGRPILVGTRTIDASRELSALLKDMKITYRLLNGVQDEAEANIISQAGQYRAITIATNMAGRGTDIKLSDESHEAGGLHVMSLEFHDAQRIDRQLAGRAARQGQPGSVQFFASADDELFEKHDPRLAEAIRRNGNKAETGECRKNFTPSTARVQQLAERKSYEHRCRVYQQQKWLNKVLITIAEPAQSKNQSVPKGAAA